MRKTTITIDDQKLEAVQEVLGTSGITETVDRALQAVLVQQARRRHSEWLRTNEDLRDPEIMANAWRS
ncbi:MAG: type II toxin-antitoxin system VapB family antitoxin [Actinomycetota bacterium]|nr:type II toxin-antitoxin system VapB family antitoxin [Actinomycetota bacterium]MDQ3409215.1 type II toxin-antitoxin system VapB family antitoxin [Actinomycetota bacterium]